MKVKLSGDFLKSIKTKAIGSRKIVVAVLVFFVLISLPYIFYQSRLLSYGFLHKEVVKIEFVSYSEEAFTSEPVFISELNENFSDKIINAICRQEVHMFGSKSTSEVLFIYFSDSSTLSAFVNGDSLGIDYGRVWISIDGLGKQIESLKPLIQTE